MPVAKSEGSVFYLIFFTRKSVRNAIINDIITVFCFSEMFFPMDHSCILPEIHCYSGLSDKPSHIFLYIRKDSSLHIARKASVGYNHIKAAPKKYYLCVSVHPHSTQGGLYFEELPLPARNQRSDHSRYTWMHPGYIFRHIPFFSMA